MAFAECLCSMHGRKTNYIHTIDSLFSLVEVRQVVNSISTFLLLFPWGAGEREKLARLSLTNHAGLSYYLPY